LQSAPVDYTSPFLQTTKMTCRFGCFFSFVT
jgi:hypothetical protein